MFKTFSRSKLDTSMDPLHLDMHPAKRHHSSSSNISPRVSPNGVLNLTQGPIRLEDISLSREIRERERVDRERLERDRIPQRDRDNDRERQFANSYNSKSRYVNNNNQSRFHPKYLEINTILQTYDI